MINLVTAISLVIAVVFPAAGFTLTVTAWPAVVVTMMAVVDIVMIALAGGTAITASITSIIASSTAVVSVILERLLIASIVRAAVITLGFSSLRETVKSTIVEVTLMLQAHELGDVLHQRRVEFLANGKEGEAMLLAVGTEVLFLYFIFRRV